MFALKEVGDSFMEQTQSLISFGAINGFGDSMTEPKLIQHHIKYKEIHGKDEIVLMTRSEHKKLHDRLRREGKCKISSEELHKISSKAHRRTKYAISKSIEYQKTPHRKLLNKINSMIWHDKLQRLDFWETISAGVLLREVIMLAPNGNIYYTSGFKINIRGFQQKDLKVINI